MYRINIRLSANWEPNANWPRSTSLYSPNCRQVTTNIGNCRPVRGWTAVMFSSRSATSFIRNQFRNNTCLTFISHWNLHISNSSIFFIFNMFHKTPVHHQWNFHSLIHNFIHICGVVTLWIFIKYLFRTLFTWYFFLNYNKNSLEKSSWYKTTVSYPFNTT